MPLCALRTHKHTHTRVPPAPFHIVYAGNQYSWKVKDFLPQSKRQQMAKSGLKGWSREVWSSIFSSHLLKMFKVLKAYALNVRSSNIPFLSGCCTTLQLPLIHEDPKTGLLAMAS